jgi:CHASE3 domain sensor protein
MIIALVTVVFFVLGYVYILCKNRELEQRVSKITINTQPIIQSKNQLQTYLAETRRNIDRLEDYIRVHKGGKDG